MKMSFQDHHGPWGVYFHIFWSFFYGTYETYERGLVIIDTTKASDPSFYYIVYFFSTKNMEII